MRMHDYEEIVDRLYLEWVEEHFDVNPIRAMRLYETESQALEVAMRYEDGPRTDLIMRKLSFLEDRYPELLPEDDEVAYLEGGLRDGEIYPISAIPEGYVVKEPAELVDDIPVWIWVIAGDEPEDEPEPKSEPEDFSEEEPVED